MLADDGQRDMFIRELEKQRQIVLKRETEMKEVVRTLKQFHDDKTYLEKENERLRKEHDDNIGHKNPNQKIQLHLKIKEENNRFREENYKLQEELKRKCEVIARNGQGNGSPQKDDDQKSQMQRAEINNLQNVIMRISDKVLLSAPAYTSKLNEDQLSSLQGKVTHALEILSCNIYKKATPQAQTISPPNYTKSTKSVLPPKGQSPSNFQQKYNQTTKPTLARSGSTGRPEEKHSARTTSH